MLVFQALILEHSLIYLKYCTKVVTPKRKDTSFVAGTPNCDSLIFLHCYMNKIEKKKKKYVRHKTGFLVWIRGEKAGTPVNLDTSITPRHKSTLTYLM